MGCPRRRPHDVDVGHEFADLSLDLQDVVALRVSQIAAQEHVFREYVTSLTAQRQALGSTGKDGAFLKALALDATLFHSEAHLRWLAHCKKLLTGESGNDAIAVPIAARKAFDAPKMPAKARA